MNLIDNAIALDQSYQKNKGKLKEVLTAVNDLAQGGSALKLTVIAGTALASFSECLPPPVGVYVGFTARMVTNVVKSLDPEASKSILADVPQLINAALNECHRIQKNAQSTELKEVLTKFESDLNKFQINFNTPETKNWLEKVDEVLFPETMEAKFKDFKASIQTWKQTIEHELHIETHEQVVGIHTDTKHIASEVDNLKNNMILQESKALQDSIAEKLKQFHPFSVTNRQKFASSRFVAGTLVQKEAEIKSWYKSDTIGYLLQSEESTGKTVFASKIEDILSSSISPPLVAYFFPQKESLPPVPIGAMTEKSKRHKLKEDFYKPMNVIASFARQLARKDVEFAKILSEQPILERNLNEDADDEIPLLFQELLVDTAQRSQKTVVLVIDSVEYLLSHSTKSMMKLIDCFADLEHTTPIRFVFTSAMLYDLEWFQGKKTIFFPLQFENDIQTYIRSSLIELFTGAPKKVDYDLNVLVNRIVTKISNHGPIKSYQRARNLKDRIWNDFLNYNEEGTSSIDEYFDKWINEAILYSCEHVDRINSLMGDPLWKLIVEFFRIHWNFQVISLYEDEYGSSKFTTIENLHQIILYEGFDLRLDDVKKIIGYSKEYFETMVIDEIEYTTTSSNVFSILYEQREQDDQEWFDSIINLWIQRGLKVFKEHMVLPIYKSDIEIHPLLKYYAEFWHLALVQNSVTETKLQNSIVKEIRNFFNPEDASVESPPYILLWLELTASIGSPLNRSDIIRIKEGVKYGNERDPSLVEDFHDLDIFFDELGKVMLDFGDIINSNPSEIFKSLLLALPTNSMLSRKYLANCLDTDYELVYTDRHDWPCEICRYETDSDGVFGLFTSLNEIGIATQKGIEIYSLDSSTKMVLFVDLPNVYKFGGIFNDEFLAAVVDEGIHKLVHVTLGEKGSTEIIKISHPGSIDIMTDIGFCPYDNDDADTEETTDGDESTTDEDYTITTSQNRLYMWNLTTKSEVPVISLQFDSVIKAVNMDFGHQDIFVGLEDGKLIHWSRKLSKGRIITVVDSYITGIISGCEKWEIIYTRLDGVISVYHVEQDVKLAEFADHRHPIIDFKLDRKKKMLITISDHMKVRFWDLKTYVSTPLKRMVLPLLKPSQVCINSREMLILACFSDSQLPVLCSLDVNGYEDDGSDEFTSLQLKTTLTDMHVKFEDSMLLSISENAETIATMTNGRLIVYDKKGIVKAQSNEILENVYSICLSNDGQTIVTFRHGYNEVTLWDTNCVVLGRFTSHQTDITAGYVSADGQYIVSGSVSGTVIVWNRQLEELQRYKIGQPIEAVTMNQDRSLLALSIDMGDYQCEVRIIDWQGLVKYKFFVKYDCNGLRFNPESTKLLICNGTPNHKALIYDFVNDIETPEMEHCFVTGSSLRYVGSEGIYEFDWDGIQKQPLCYHKNSVGLRGIMHSLVDGNRRIFHYYGNEVIIFSIPFQQNAEFDKYEPVLKDRKVEAASTYLRRLKNESDKMNESFSPLAYIDDILKTDFEFEPVLMNDHVEVACEPVVYTEVNFFELDTNEIVFGPMPMPDVVIPNNDNVEPRNDQISPILTNTDLNSKTDTVFEDITSPQLAVTKDTNSLSNLQPPPIPGPSTNISKSPEVYKTVVEKVPYRWFPCIVTYHHHHYLISDKPT